MAGKEVSENRYEYGDAQKNDCDTYPFRIFRSTNIRIVKFDKGNWHQVVSEDYNLTGIVDDPNYPEQTGYYNTNRKAQNNAINQIIMNYGGSWSSLPGTINNFEEVVGSGKYIYNKVGTKILCRTEGNVPNVNSLIGRFSFHHQQPRVHDYEVLWDRIDPINYCQEKYINQDDYAITFPAYEFVNGINFKYKSMLTGFLQDNNFWETIVHIPSYPAGCGIETDAVDVNIFNENSMDFGQDLVCYIPTTSALDIRKTGNSYTESNCLTNYTLADKINTVINPAAGVNSPYQIYSGYAVGNCLHDYFRSNANNITNELYTTLIPKNLILSKTSISNGLYKAKNNIYMGNDFFIKWGVKMEAGNEIIIEPGTKIEDIDYIDVEFKINPDLKNGGKKDE